MACTGKIGFHWLQCTVILGCFLWLSILELVLTAMKGKIFHSFYCFCHIHVLHMILEFIWEIWYWCICWADLWALLKNWIPCCLLYLFLSWKSIYNKWVSHHENQCNFNVFLDGVHWFTISVVVMALISFVGSGVQNDSLVVMASFVVSHVCGSNPTSLSPSLTIYLSKKLSLLALLYLLELDLKLQMLEDRA